MTLAAQSFRITGTSQVGGEVAVRYEAELDYYYVLWRGTEADALSRATDVALGKSRDPAPGEGELRDTDSASAVRFYQIERIPLDAPRDLDGDQIDDVTELAHPSALNPLDPTDADADPDFDGLATRVELALDTDPAVSDSDGDGWNDETEVTSGHDPLERADHPLPFVASAPVATVTLAPPEASHGTFGSLVAGQGHVAVVSPRSPTDASCMGIGVLAGGARTELVSPATPLDLDNTLLGFVAGAPSVSLVLPAPVTESGGLVSGTYPGAPRVDLVSPGPPGHDGAPLGIVAGALRVEFIPQGAPRAKAAPPDATVLDPAGAAPLPISPPATPTTPRL